MAPFQSTGRRRWRRMSTADAEIDQLDGLVRYFRRGLDQLEALTEQTERAEAKRRERAHVTYVPWRDAATAYLIALGVVFVALAAVGVAAVLYQAVASGTAVAGALGALGALMVVAVAAIAVVRPASGESVCPHCCSEARYVAELRQAASAWATAAREQREVVSHLIGSVSAESAASADAEEIPARARNGASGSSPEDDSAAGAAHAERDSRRRSPSPSAAALSRLDELHALRDWRASLAVLREGAEQGEQDPRPDPGLAPPPDRVPGSQRLAAEEERALAAMASREARVGLCWRAARVYMTAASRVGDEECAKDLIRAGLWFTERARHDDPQCARAHTTCVPRQLALGQDPAVVGLCLSLLSLPPAMPSCSPCRASTRTRRPRSVRSPPVACSMRC